ncbi:MAG: hypothetical protein JWP80_4936 [Pseudomonas sp.]|nr:hypothetical protein [Pseudomonas sp.]
MSGTSFITLRKVLAVAVIAEVGTGIALLLAPSRVSTLLLGATSAGVAEVFARLFGCALLALGVACWPRVPGSEQRWAMLFYNAAAALYLAYVGLLVGSGLLLWPAVVFHVVMAGLLIRRL